MSYPGTARPSFTIPALWFARSLFSHEFIFVVLVALAAPPPQLGHVPESYSSRSSSSSSSITFPSAAFSASLALLPSVALSVFPPPRSRMFPPTVLGSRRDTGGGQGLSAAGHQAAVDQVEDQVRPSALPQLPAPLPLSLHPSIPT